MMWFDPQEKIRARSEWRINNRKGILFFNQDSWYPLK
jgi:hypothetical protein